MFSNVSEKIRISSIVVFFILSVASFAGAVLYWSTIKTGNDINFIIGVGIIVGGLCVALLSSLLIQSFSIIVKACETYCLTKEAEENQH